MNMNSQTPNFITFFRRRPDAYAALRGSSDYPEIEGRVFFYTTDYGTVVLAIVEGLPTSSVTCASPIFAFHIHSGSSCTGNAADPFSNVGTHYNPHGCPHPYHSGDLPPLFGAGGYAFSAVLTDRFTVEEVIGKTVIIHSSPDDFTTQPSGNAGAKIACGEIVPRRQR